LVITRSEAFSFIFLPFFLLFYASVLKTTET